MRLSAFLRILTLYGCAGALGFAITRLHVFTRDGGMYLAGSVMGAAIVCGLLIQHRDSGRLP